MSANSEQTEVCLTLHDDKGRIRPKMTIDGENNFVMLSDSFALTLGDEPAIRYEGFNRLKEQKLKTKNLNAQLRPYQEEGIKWIKYLYDNNLGGCLADDMGLGKTVQTIGMLTMIYPKEKKPTLPVASAQIRMPENLVVNPSPFINHA